MIKVKSFGEPLQPFKTRRELDELDQQVNDFLQRHNISRVISVSDVATSEDGSTIGLVRVVTYED